MTDDSGAKVTPLPRRRRRCPICGKPATTALRPFCSKRCADVDLGRWLGEVYRVPVEEEDGGLPDDHPENEP
ncbi:MAG: DNA gyrase inhibitor YacG [Rhodospirillales bacterium]|nr:DNA gyrase inhibitor YacG [Rhodospirillales bacterium]